MARSLLVAPAAEGVGLARTCLGLLRALDRRGVKVAFVKPVAQPRADGSPDRSVARVTATTALRPPEPLSTAELESQLGEGGLDVAMEKIVAAWEPTYDSSDVVVVEGLSPGPRRLYASSLNQALARALDADVLLVGGWPADADADALGGHFAIAASGYVSGEQARVVGCVVHGLPGTDTAATAELRGALAKHKLRLIAAVPHRPELTWPRVRDLVRELRPEVLHEGDLSRRIKDVAVMAPGHPGRHPRPGHRAPCRGLRRPARGHHGRLLGRAERNPPGRPAAERRDRARSAGQPAHPGHRGGRPARPARQVRQLPDRDPGTGPTRQSSAALRWSASARCCRAWPSR
jgi:phosphate acetyltransferase